ncbi:hypothetical protein [Urbifossiella limnaea]|uniref:DUF4328 domain-containing protein n=1 Tax=Urbifossiella limnaea TaxID=2528023 RepID=A0A517XPA0_9BACT|nr:hypothetical protein [Urbifossiella limnaea]QDU19325.1 hypothetical protein ETAA1_12310 [Urbifossiella limnaea]
MDGDDLLFLFFFVFVVGFAVGLVLLFRFLSALQRALRRVHPDLRRMEPGQVWLNFIPVFNVVWAPVTVVLVAESLRNEYRARGLDAPDADYGRTSGLTLLTLLATGCLFYPAFLTYPVALVVWGRYWFVVNRYARELRSGEGRERPAAAVLVDEGW